MLTFEKRLLCGNAVSWFSSGLERDPEPTRGFVPLANTTDDYKSTSGLVITFGGAVDWKLRKQK